MAVGTGRAGCNSKMNEILSLTIIFKNILLNSNPEEFSGIKFRILCGSGGNHLDNDEGRAQKSNFIIERPP